ncbi:MAG: hypothetical protein EXR86_07040 [Gammaproteobacteria bacterium]|nr:hypothetical protein [Gammaproteobacteria bacterium]
MRAIKVIKFAVLASSLGGGCAGAPTLPTDLHEGLVTNGEIWLLPLVNPQVALTTSGTVGPAFALGSADRGFGEYDGHLQSSLHVCAATGPAAGACLAVLGGLFALAGASMSLLYSLQQGASGKVETSTTRAAFADNPTLADLSAEIARRTAALAQRVEAPILVTATSPDNACADTTPNLIPRGIVRLDLAELKVDFEPGYQFKLTIVSRLRTQFCGGDRPTVERRLAHLGRLTSMSRDPRRASLALGTEVEAAIAALRRDINAYIHASLLGQY